MKRMANGGSVGEGALASRAVERALAVPTDSKMTFNFSVPQLPGLDKTLSAGAVPPISAADKDKDKAGNQMVNVWVVSKDNIPPPGPRDIIAMVASDIQNKGSIRSLIQQVNLGTI